MGYTATITKDMPRVQRISRDFGMISGSCDFSEYHQTGVAITDITKYFKPGTATALRVICEGLSSNGYLVRWNATGMYFDAFYPVTGNVFQYEPDFAIAVKPVIALHYDANPPGVLGAQPLFAYEAQGRCVMNTLNLESTTESNTDVWGETANGTVGLIAASVRFHVTDNNAPNGVAIYVNESTNDQLEFISPSATDGYIIMPFEAAAGAPGGFACAVKVHHSATADAGGGIALSFDDNGAADAQLIYVDTGTSDGVIPAADITVLSPGYIADAAASAAASTEVDNAVDVGLINFIAIGLI